MRVLQVINSLKAGGAEKLLVDACRKYTAQGLEIDVLLLDGLKTDFYKKLKAVPKVNIYDLGENNDVYSPQNIFKIKKYLKDYDVVHVHLFPASYMVALAKMSIKSKAKYIFTEHNTTNRRRNSNLWKPFEYFIYKKYDTIVSISEAVDTSLRQHLKKVKIPIRLIKNGIDLQEINAAEPYTKKELGFEQNKKLILQVSSFTVQKDQTTAIRALQFLDSSILLLLVGEGPLKKKCEKLAKNINVGDRVHFLGFRNDVPRLLKSADIIVLSSHFEGLSLASVEGLASARPFVSSDVPGLHDVVINAGVLYPEGDAQALSISLIKLLKDRSYYENIVTSCLKRAQSYDINIMVSKYIDLYKNETH